MDKNQVVGHIKIDTILQKSESLTVVLFPNYEDRTCGVIDEIRKFCNIQQLSGRINFLMFCLKNKSNNNMLLEDLKERNIEAIKKRLGNVPINEFWLEYPSNFSSNALKVPIQRILEEKYRTSEQNADILFDISTIPQSILFHLCENIKEFIRGDIIGNIYFAYCLPQKYSEVPYAQDIGLLKGLFSGKPLHFSPSQSIHTILFPSRTGHEGKLLCDSLDSISRNTSYSIYFPIHKDNFIASLGIMQANQSLIDRESYLNYFYCTLDDAIKDLDELFQKEFIKIQHIIKLEEERQLEEVKELEEARKLEPEKELEKKRELEEKRAGPIVSQVYLVAPFGAKVFLPVAYFELFNLRSVATEVITVEIANVKGFQYTSSYSLGVGKITCFELNGGIIADVLRKN